MDMKKVFLSLLLLSAMNSQSQDKMTPELLWKLKRIGAEGMSGDGKQAYYSSRQYDVKTEKSSARHYAVDVASGQRREVTLPANKSVFQKEGRNWYAMDDKAIYASRDNGKTWGTLYSGLKGAENVRVSPNGKYIAFSKDV